MANVRIAPLFVLGLGGVFLWSAVTGKSVSSALRDILKGESPSQAKQTLAIKGTPASALANSGYGYDANQPPLINTVGPESSGTYTPGMLQSLWILAGGDPAKAAVAACIAMKESTGNPRARNTSPCGIGSYAEGLWQICMPENSRYVPGGDAFIALANARAAVALSKNGTDWSDWSTESLCV